jgi:hypothetical protein
MLSRGFLSADIEEFFFRHGVGSGCSGACRRACGYVYARWSIQYAARRVERLRRQPIDGDLTWTLKLPDTLKSRFKDQEVTDIFLVISYRGLLEDAA